MQKATRQSTKEHNLRLVLNTIFEREEISRADVARATGLSKATVSDQVNDLMEKGLVSETRSAEIAIGKPPLLLEIVRDARHLICADLANQEFRGAIVNLRGEFLHTINLPRDGRVGKQAIQLLYQLLDELLKKTDRPLLGIGIGTPGLIDSDTGIIQNAVNMGWQHVPLGEMLAKRYKIPVHLANDSQIAALAEYIFSDCQPQTNLVAIKLGRGIGAGIVLNGQLYQGDGFGAGEIGHIRVCEDGILCRCGNTGCLETVATSRAVVQRAQALASTWTDSVLYALTPEEIDFQTILQAFHEGDPLTIGIIQEAGRAFGLAVANLIGILNIQHITLSGDMTGLGQPWLEITQQYAVHSTLTALAKNTKISLSCLNENEVIQGASALLLTRELGISPKPFFAFKPSGTSL